MSLDGRQTSVGEIPTASGTQQLHSQSDLTVRFMALANHPRRTPVISSCPSSQPSVLMHMLRSYRQTETTTYC